MGQNARMRDEQAERAGPGSNSLRHPTARSRGWGRSAVLGGPAAEGFCRAASQDHIL